MAEQTPNPDYQETAMPMQEENTVPPSEQLNNSTGTEAKTEAAAGDAAINDPAQSSRQLGGAPNKMETAGTSTENYFKQIMDRAVRFILDNNTVVFKDFYFPSNVQVLLYNRMQQKIDHRIKALNVNRVEGDVKSIVKVYRSHHCKADDIKYLMNSFYEIELLYQEMGNMNVGASGSANAEAMPEPQPTTSNMVLEIPPQELTMGNASKAEVVMKNEPKGKRKSSIKRVVRFKKSDEICVYWAEPGDTLAEE